MNIFTSIAPRRIERQRFCLESWRACGFNVHAVQTVSECDAMRNDWHDLIGLAHSVSNDRVRLADIWRVATTIGGWSCLLNSDIELDEQAVALESCNEIVANGLLYLQRWNCGPRRSNPIQEPWGIDGFCFNSEANFQPFPEAFVVGNPWWDYVLPMAYADAARPIFTVSIPLLFHERHDLHWSKEDRKALEPDYMRLRGIEPPWTDQDVYNQAASVISFLRCEATVLS